MGTSSRSTSARTGASGSCGVIVLTSPSAPAAHRARSEIEIVLARRRMMVRTSFHSLDFISRSDSSMPGGGEPPGIDRASHRLLEDRSRLRVAVARQADLGVDFVLEEVDLTLDSEQLPVHLVDPVTHGVLLP